MRSDQLTIYPGTELRRAAERISEQDHGRPISKVVEMALKAYCVLYERDKYEAIRLADSFGKSNSK
jgi:hypothetical protein